MPYLSLTTVDAGEMIFGNDGKIKRAARPSVSAGRRG
jgi:hypothetical protein